MKIAKRLKGLIKGLRSEGKKKQKKPYKLRGQKKKG